MYGIYDEKIMELKGRIIEIDEELAEIRGAITYISNKYGSGLVRPYEYAYYNSIDISEVLAARECWDELRRRREGLSAERMITNTRIDMLKQAWRDSRPRDNYYPVSDHDIMHTIRDKGFINGSLI